MEIPSVLPSETKCQQTEPFVGLSINAVSGSFTGSCGTRAIFDHAGSVTPILPPKYVNRLPPTHSTFMKYCKQTLHLTTRSTARFETSAAACLRSSFFWNVTQPRFMIGYRRFGTACQSSLPRSSSKRRA